MIKFGEVDNLLSILTSVLANISKLGMNPLPGLTCFSVANISLALAPGSCIFLRIQIFLYALLQVNFCLSDLSEELVAGEAYNLERLVRVPLCECIESEVLRNNIGIIGNNVGIIGSQNSKI